MPIADGIHYDTRGDGEPVLFIQGAGVPGGAWEPQSTFARGREASSPTGAMIWIGLRTYVGTRRMRRHAFLEIVLAASGRASLDLDAEAKRFGRLFERDLADPAKIAMAQLRSTSAYDVTGLDLSTLVVSGAEDILAKPEYGRALAAKIPNSTFHAIAEAAHGAPITHADEVNRLLLDHISKTTARSSADNGRDRRGSALS